MLSKRYHGFDEGRFEGFDVVVNAFGVWDPDKMGLHSTVLNHLSNLLSGSSIRLLVVGGAGSLYTDKTHTMMISDVPDFRKIINRWLMP